MSPEQFRLTSSNFPSLAREQSARYPEFQQILSEYGMPEFWHRPAGFETLCLIILEQQVSLKSAASVYKKIESSLGEITPARISDATENGLRALGITRQKARYLSALADAVQSGSLDLDSLAAQSDAEAFHRLTQLPGIGAWTANVYLMSALGRPDLWPRGDLALIKAVRHFFPQANDELLKEGARWTPLRSVAVRLFWHWYLCR